MQLTEEHKSKIANPAAWFRIQLLFPQGAL